MGTGVLKLSDAQTLRIVSSTEEVLELESTWAAGPGKPPPRHYHPKQQERFEVLAGELTVEVGDEPARALTAGESLSIPEGVAHRMWNVGTEEVRARWVVTPALRTEEMFRFIDAGLSPVRVATMLWRFRNEFRPAFTTR